MATSPAPHTGVERPLAGEGFSRQEHYDNLTILDGFPGAYLCTSGTRPSWGGAHDGMTIFETDRRLEWRWDAGASDFERVRALGVLGSSSVTSDDSTPNTTPTNIITSAVTVPAFTPGSTTKRIKIEASWFAIDNGDDSNLGAAEVSILNGSTVIKKLRLIGRPDSAAVLERGQGGTIVAWDTPSAGSQTYHLAINSVAAIGGTTYLRASASTPADLVVSEVGL